MELKQHFTRLGALAAAGAIGIASALALVSSAQAEDPATTTIELKEPHRGVTVNEGDWGKNKCGDDFQVPDDKPADQDGWVFILPKNSGDAFVSLTATFEDFDGATHEIEADIVSPGESGLAKHAYVEAPAGWTLVTAFAEVEGADEGDVFNITHTCAGQVPDGETPTDGETTTPDVETTSPGEDETSPGEASTSPAGDDTLPTTGAPLTIALVSAAALAAAGGAIFFMMRRRAAQDW